MNIILNILLIMQKFITEKTDFIEGKLFKCSILQKCKLLFVIMTQRFNDGVGGFPAPTTINLFGETELVF